MDRIFNPQNVNSYSSDELFEFIETGIIPLEQLKELGLNEPSLFELEKRIMTFREIKELDDWNSVKDSNIDEIEKFLSKYSSCQGKFYNQARDIALSYKKRLSLESEIEDIKETEFQQLYKTLRAFQKAHGYLKEIMYDSDAQERIIIQQKLVKLESILHLLEEIIRLINPRKEPREYCNCARSINEESEYNECPRPTIRILPKDDSKQSYTPQQLSNNSSKKKKTLCNSAVFAPAEIAKGDDLFVQVYIYKDEETDKVVVDSRMSDKDSIQRSYTPLYFPIKAGDKISVRLDMKGLSVEGDTTKSVIWQNKYTKCSFFVYVPINYEKTKVKGEVYLSVNGLELGRMSFFSTIKSVSDLLHSAQVETKIYEKVFISYSHKDDATAKSIAEAYKALGTVDYFYDRHTLSPGEMFEKKIYEFIDQCDLFVLCWSKNAEKSEWVKKERVRAFYRAIDIPPRLKLYPINIPPYALPPSDLANKIHFEDYDKLIELSENQEEPKE